MTSSPLSSDRAGNAAVTVDNLRKGDRGISPNSYT